MKNIMWGKKLTETMFKVPTLIIFTFFDFLDSILCIIYLFIDEFFEGTSTPCYCFRREDNNNESELSETLFRRHNIFRKMMGNLFIKSKWSLRKSEPKLEKANVWSDCGCQSCVSWMNGGDDLLLHVVVQDPAPGEKSEIKLKENVVFLHGFISSSSFWTQTAFCNMPEHGKKYYRLFAVDLLGFGRSPKPRDCKYTLRDHVEMIEKSVIEQFNLNSFHLVAHSMGSIIALALAAKYPHLVKSITLIAPPYYPSSNKEDASLFTFSKVAEKRLWPPLLFGASFMSWYEHLGRTVCFIICRNHRVWEFLLKPLTLSRDLHFMIMDLTMHTHHSAWHTMHNVICGGAKFMDEYFRIVSNTKMKLAIIQGDEDQVVPLQCSYDIKMKVPEADVRIIPETNHTTVVLRQRKEFTKDLVGIWMSCDRIVD